MNRYETLNSVYIFDEDAKRYIRLPLIEAPRHNPSWRLQDGTWIEYKTYSIQTILGQRCLRIHTIDAVHGVTTSPIVKESNA